MGSRSAVDRPTVGRSPWPQSCDVTRKSWERVGCASLAIPAARSPTSSSRRTASFACTRPRRRSTTRCAACSTRWRWPPRTRAWRCADFLAQGETFIHGTTRAINAILTGSTARTAFLTTAGHPDILVIREGGRIEPFNFTVPYPEPYVPRALTFEIPERIDATGKIVTPLDEAAVRARDREPAREAASRRSASACSGRSPIPATSSGSARCSPSTCRACRSPCRTSSTRRCASTGAPPRPASTPRSSR